MAIDNLKYSESVPVRQISIKKDKRNVDDIRFKKSGFKKCIQCGRCTGSCPATTIYSDFNPRDLMRRFMFNDVHTDEINEIIWKCGQCYSCRARCPRNCKAGLGIISLQNKSVIDDRAPQEIVGIGEEIKKNLYTTGESFLPSTYQMDLEEFGKKTAERCLDNPKRREKLGFKKDDARDVPIPEESIEEIRKILILTGYWGDEK